MINSCFNFQGMIICSQDKVNGGNKIKDGYLFKEEFLDTSFLPITNFPDVFVSVHLNP